jgi:pilus assembly protein CpaE
VKEFGVGVETQIPDGEGICLVTVGLDAEAAEQVRQAALQAHVGIAATLPNYAETLLNVQLKKLLGNSGALACLIDFDGNKDLAVQMASGVLALAANHTTLIALSAEESPDLILYAMRAGCTEYLTKPLQGQQLAELLRKLRERWLSAARRSIQTNGRVLAFIGVRGGAGATTIAVHLGSFLARRQGQKTLIVDQHPGLGHVALMLGMDGHSYNFHELLQNISRLDLMLLKSYVSHHCSGVEVLPSPDVLGGNIAIDGEALERAIRFVAGVYNFVLIDCPVGLGELNLATIAGCDEIYLVATPEVPALRDLARYLDRWRELQLPPEKVRVVINQYGAGRSVTVAQIEQAIEHPVGLTLSADAANLTRALDTGQPISPEQKSAFGNQIKKWAAELAPALVQPVETKHRFAFWM